MSARTPKIDGPPPETENNRSVASAAVVQISLDAGQCEQAYSTNQTTNEAAIIALRASVEALYRLEERKRPLFQIAEGLNTTIGCVFYRRQCRALGKEVPQRWRVDEYGWEPRARLSSASRLRIAAEMDRLIEAAQAAGLDEIAIRDALYAPLIAAEDQEEARRRSSHEATARLVASWNAGERQNG